MWDLNKIQEGIISEKDARTVTLTAPVDTGATICFYLPL
jgi:hypothetical protein